MLEEWDGDEDAEGMGWDGEATRILKERSRDADEDRMVMPMQEVWRHKSAQDGNREQLQPHFPPHGAELKQLPT